MNPKVNSADFLIADLSIAKSESKQKLVPVPHSSDDYTEAFKKYSIDYKVDDQYIYVGEPRVSQGWILHITVLPTQMVKLLDAVLPGLSQYDVPYKIVKNMVVHKNTNSGDYGSYKIGKAITIFLDDESIIEPLTKKLLLLTEGFSGPQVLSDFTLGNILFTRYGSFITRVEEDALGNRVRVISDGEGTLILDLYHTPPIVPKGIFNPFLSFIQQPKERPKINLVGNKYMPVKLLKNDPKGDVWKALYFNKYLLPNWCVVKQGRKGMAIDEYGRDSRERLVWQNEVGKVIKKSIPTARIIDLLEDEGHLYLAMKYIKGGKDLKSVILDKLKCNAWFTQPAGIQLEVLEIFVQILNSVTIIHKHNYVHRDLTAGNFLVTRSKKVYLIDMELFYSISTDRPSPPFGVGTPGYMSPQQEGEEQPTYQDDIYSLGGLLLLIFTSGLSPRFVVESNSVKLFEKLFFLIRNNDIAKLITDCLAEDPGKRPTLNHISEVINDYVMSLKSNPKLFSEPKLDNLHLIEETIQKSINTLSGDLLVEENLWFSAVENDYGRDVYPLGDKHAFTSIYRGIAGPIWLLSRLQQARYNIEKAAPKIQEGLRHICAETIPKLDFVSRSLYYGKAGFALTLVRSIQSNFLPDTPEYRDIISRCFQEPANGYDILHGVSGQGLGALQCLNYLSDQAKGMPGEYANLLISRQQVDGSWLKTSNLSEKGEKNTGFGYGMAGIIYFLLEYSQAFDNKEALNAAVNGLSYLNRTARSEKEHLEWATSDKDKGIGGWWCKGSPGIALSFLKGYELTHDTSYLDVANRALRIHDKYLAIQTLSQCHGIAGLGEIYLEAHGITGNEEWRDRALWIAEFLCHYSKQPDNETVFWTLEKKDFPTADFMVGDSGIVHFLLRCIHPTRLGFPIIS